MRTSLMPFVLSLTFLSLSPMASAQVDPKVQRAWKAKCAACHGEDGKGQTDTGKKIGVSDMSAAAWQKKFSDEQIKTVMIKGIKETRAGKEVEMPAIADMKPEIADGLLKLVRGFAK